MGSLLNIAKEAIENQDTVLTIHELLSKKEDAVLEIFEGNTQKFEKFKSNIIRLFVNNENLSKCTPYSILGSAMQAAYLNLDLDPNLGQAYVIARWNKNLNGKGIGGYEATFQTGYQGLIELVRRTGLIKSINTQIVYENEPLVRKFTIYGEVFEHSPLTPSLRGEKKMGAYAHIALLDGGYHLEYMWAEEILTIKELSTSKDSKFSPWNANKTSVEAMWKKTVLRRASKYLSKSTTLAKVLKMENAYDEFGQVDFARVVDGQEPFISTDEDIIVTDNTKTSTNNSQEPKTKNQASPGTTQAQEFEEISIQPVVDKQTTVKTVVSNNNNPAVQPILATNKINPFDKTSQQNADTDKLF